MTESPGSGGASKGRAVVVSVLRDVELLAPIAAWDPWQEPCWQGIPSVGVRAW